MDQDDRGRLAAYRSRLRQARRLAQILPRQRRYKARRLSLAPVSFLDVEAHRVRHHTDDHVY